MGQGFRLDPRYYTAPGAPLRGQLETHGVPFDTYFRRVVHPPEFVREDLDEPGRAFLRAQNVRPGETSNREPVSVPEAVYDTRTEARAATDDLILVRTGANLGDLARVTPDWTGVMVSSHTLRLVPADNAPVCSLEFFLWSPSGRALLLGLRSGGTHGQINADNLKARKLADAIHQSRSRSAETLAAAERHLTAAWGLDRLDLSPQKGYSRPFGDLLAEERFDAVHFNPKYQRVIDRLRTGGRTLAEVAPLATRLFRPTGEAVRHIEIGSLTGDGEA